MERAIGAICRGTKTKQAFLDECLQEMKQIFISANAQTHVLQHSVGGFFQRLGAGFVEYGAFSLN